MALFFFFRASPPPRRGGALMPAPSRSRSWTLSSLQLVHRGDRARSTQQCVAQSELATDLCRWQQEQRGELTSIWKRANFKVTQRNRLLLRGLLKVSCRPQISDLYNCAGPQKLAERLIHRTMLNPKPRR